MPILSGLSRALFALSAFVCLPTILTLIGLDVVRRYFFNAPLVWAQEAATLALFLAIVLALPESWRRDVHIKADFLTATMSRRLNDALARLGWLLVIGVSGLIVVQCWRDIDLMILFNERSTDLDLPLTWFRGALAVSALATALVALGRIAARHPSIPLEGDNP